MTKKPIVFLMLIFIVPMLASFFLYQYRANFQFKTTNRGTLIQPPFQVTNKVITDQASKWQILYVTGKTCNGICMHNFHLLQQIQKAMGKESQRLSVQKQDAQFEFESSSQNSFMASTTLQNKIFLIDPHGFVFMYYDDTTNPMNILKDLKHVLKVSQIG